MRRLNNYILCVIVSILLFFAAAGAEGMYLVKNKVLEPSVYHDILEKNDVYSKIYSEIQKHFESEENATGIPAEIYMDAVTPELVRTIVDENLDSAFSYIKGNSEKYNYSVLDTEFAPLKESIEKFFDDYAASVNYTKDEAYYSKVETIFNNAEAYIAETADVYQFSKIDKAGYLSAARKVCGYTGKLALAVYIAAGVLVLVLLLLNLRGIANIFYWIAVSAGSLSSVMLAAGLYFKNSGFFNRFAIKASHIFSAITGACFEFTDRIIFMNAILFISGIIFMILYVISGKKKTE